MKNKKTVIDKIKELVFETEKVEVKFLDVQTSEGVVLRVEEDEIASGQTISLVEIVEDEEVINPVVEGEYILEDGRTVVVNADSVIVEIIEEPEEIVEEMEEVIETPPTSTKSLEEKINATIDRKTGELEEKLDNLLAKFESFSKAPADKEIKIEKKEFKKNNKMDRLDELNKFRRK